MLAIGTIGIIAWRYCGKEPVILLYWIGTNFVCSMFIIPVFALVIRYLKGLNVPFLGVVGKASYNIFLIQMLFFDIPQEYISAKITSRGLHLLFILSVCVLGGIMFWLVEQRITKKILKMTEHIWK